MVQQMNVRDDFVMTAYISWSAKGLGHCLIANVCPANVALLSVKVW